jgi:hypothetical protein
MPSYVVRKGHANTSSRESLTNSRQTLAQKTGYASGNSTSAILSLSGVKFDKGYTHKKNIELDTKDQSREELIEERNEYRDKAKEFFTTGWGHLKKSGYEDIVDIRKELNEKLADLKKKRHSVVASFVDKFSEDERKGNTFHKELREYIRTNWDRSPHDPDDWGLSKLRTEINQLKVKYGAKAKLTKARLLKESKNIFAYKLEKWLRQAVFVLMHVANSRARNDKENAQASLFWKASEDGEEQNELAYLCTKAIRNMNKKEANEEPEGRHSSHKEERAKPEPQEPRLVKEGKKKKGKKGKGKPQPEEEPEIPAIEENSTGSWGEEMEREDERQNAKGKKNANTVKGDDNNYDTINEEEAERVLRTLKERDQRKK